MKSEIELLEEEMQKRCDAVKYSDVNIYDAIQNDIMVEFFGHDYYDLIDTDDNIKEAYDITTEIRVEMELK